MCAFTLNPLYAHPSATKRAIPNLTHIPNLRSSRNPSQMVGCMPPPPPGTLYRRKLPSTLIELSSVPGKQLFKSALSQSTAEAFFPLVSQFQTQSHPALCGLTSLSQVLNALGIDPKRVWEHPWRWFTESLLDCCLDMAKLKKVGVTMDQLARVARCQGSDVTIFRELDVEEARRVVVESVRGRDDGEYEFVLASYHRGSLGQTGSGHFSPIAAYEKDSDSVLILDVARFKYGPHWVSFQDLFDATKPVDSATGLSRGFMTIRKSSADEDAA